MAREHPLQRLWAICWPFGAAPQSILRVLTWWYVVSLAAILCLFSGALYTTVSASLLRDVDKALMLRADSIANMIFSFWRAERTAGGASAPGNWQGAPSQTLLDEVERGRFLDLVDRWMQRTGQLNLGEPVRLLNRNGQLIGASTQFRALYIPIRTDAVEEGLRGQTMVQTLWRADGHIRLLTRPVRAGDSTLYLIQTAASLADVQDSLRRLRRGLLLLVPFTLLVTTSAGWVLATSALRPIDHMIDQARHIGVGNLHQRIDVPKTDDALERLGATFNDLLARLEQAFRRMRQFSAAASHELRTPLTVLKGELEVTLRKPRLPAEYQDVLRAQLETIDGMTHTVGTLLTLARSEAAEEAIEWRPVDLGVLAREVLQAWRVPAEAKQLALDLEAAAACQVVGERHLLERLLSNLLDNAVKFTPPQGRVSLRVRRNGTAALVTVEDTGPGIAPEEMPSVFERFFTPRSAAAHSTGLGLGLCRWIVEAHRGHIHIDSAPGRGTRITVSLPLTA